MNFLFWTCWTFDILLLVIVLAGKGFRSSFGAGVDLNIVLAILMVIIAVGSLVLRYAMKQKGISLVLASFPIVLMIILYMYEKVSGKSI